ncbi:MAG: hypothetical protein ACRBM6_26185 [Geminicoccales bacterium]
MRSIRPGQFFSEIIYGTRWKERQRQYHQDQGELIYGPDSLLCWVIAALFLLLFFMAGPDGLDAGFESWRWLIHGLIIFTVPGLMAQFYSNSKNPNTAYWLNFLGYGMIFLSGVMIGGIIFSRLL